MSPRTTTVREFLKGIHKIPDDYGIYARGILALDSPILIGESEDDDLPEEIDDQPLVMEVWHVIDTLEGLTDLLTQKLGRAPTQAELFDRFIEFLEE